jgi:transposase
LDVLTGPDCKEHWPCYDHGEERPSRHLDSWQFKTILKEQVDNIVNYCTYKITNGVAEGINSKIMCIKRRVGRDRNIQNFKKAISIYFGGLDLYPR